MNPKFKRAKRRYHNLKYRSRYFSSKLRAKQHRTWLNPRAMPVVRELRCLMSPSFLNYINAKRTYFKNKYGKRIDGPLDYDIGLIQELEYRYHITLFPCVGDNMVIITYKDSERNKVQAFVDKFQLIYVSDFNKLLQKLNVTVKPITIITIPLTPESPNDDADRPAT